MRPQFAGAPRGSASRCKFGGCVILVRWAPFEPEARRACEWGRQDAACGGGGRVASLGHGDPNLTATEADIAENDLLGKLSVADRGRLMPHLSVVDLAAGHVLVSAGEDVDETWFPCG